MRDSEKRKNEHKGGLTIKFSVKITTNEDPDIEDMTVEQLEAYLDELEGQLDELNANEPVITPAFQMENAKYIIHAVGPDFSLTPTAFKELFDAYYNSLYVLMENNLHSISFPLISSGIFGGSLSNPAAESAKQCCRAYKKFIEDNPDYDVTVILCAYSSNEMIEAKKMFDSMRQTQIGGAI